jgi:hypothetical protein
MKSNSLKAEFAYHVMDAHSILIHMRAVAVQDRSTVEQSRKVIEETLAIMKRY